MSSFSFKKDLTPIKDGAVNITLAISNRRNYMAQQNVSAVYAMKRQEAETGNYVLLAAEAQKKGIPVETLAQQVLAKAAELDAKVREIELDRVQAKLDITNATSKDAIDALLIALRDKAVAEGALIPENFVDQLQQPVAR
jgi:hypothetical protein